MKGSAPLVASMLAASTVALSSSSSASAQGLSSPVKRVSAKSYASSSDEKFQSRFDGLRFIETLITAHR